MKQNDVRAVLDAALKAGGDYAEIFLDDTRRNSIDYKDGKVESALTGHDYGAGIRVMLGTNVAYGYTCDTSRQALMQVALDAANALQSAKGEGC
jgi:TldD protein